MTFRPLIAAAALVTALDAGIVHASPLYFQGFEADSTDWSTNATRVASGTGGVTSADGDFHAESLDASAFHFFGAGGSVASIGTIPFTASLDFHLDVDGNWDNDTRFDYSVALSRPDNSFLRDFVFNVGFYNDSTGPGANSNRFVVSAGNNAGRGNSFPKNVGSIAIDTTGWYTFQHAFFDNSGTLGASLSILDSVGTTVNSWSIGTDPIADVGAERYGWIVNNEFSRLAYDNTSLTLNAEATVPAPATLALMGLGLAGLGWKRRKTA